MKSGFYLGNLEVNNVGKKRDKANENIEILIDELITEKISNLGNNCPYWRNDVRPCEKYDNDCSWCKAQWGEDKRERLLDEYIVK